MKTIKTIALFAVCVACVFAGSRPSLGQDAGFYVKADLGGNWTKDIELREFFGTPLAPNSKITLDPGIRFGMGGGYSFNDWFALEGEFGVFENSIESVTGASQVHNAYFGNVPFLVNAKLRWPTRSGFQLYLGAGVGFSETFFSVDQLAINNVSLHGSDANVVFAWQAFGGVQYIINKHIVVGAEYQFFAADPASWEAEDVFGTLSNHMSVGPTQSQSVSLTFNYRF